MKFLKFSLKAGCYLAITLIFALHTSAADVRTLKSISVQSLERFEQVHLAFDREYGDTPLINFEPGSLMLRLEGTTLDPVLPSLLLPESNQMIKAVRTYQTPNTRVVQLEIIFQSSRMLLEYPEVQADGTNLVLNLQLNPPSQQHVPASTNQLAEEVGQRVRGDDAFPSTFTREKPPQPVLSAEDLLFQPDRDWVATLVTLVLSLLFVLLLIYLLAILYNRFLAGRFPALQGRQKIKMVSTYHVAPKQKIIVLQINEEFFACAVTPTSINLISKLKDAEDQSFMDTIRPDTPSEGIDIDRSRAEFLRALEKARAQAKSMAPGIPESSTVPEDIPTDDTQEQTESRPEKEKPLVQASESPGKSSQEPSFSTPVRSPFTIPNGETSSETTLNPAIQDFASKLSQKLKSLKPIK